MTLFTMALLGLILWGCAGRLPSVLPPISPEAALRALASASFTDTRAVTAMARIEIIHRGDRYPLKAALMMKKPDFLRVESIPIMGPPDFYLSTAKGDLRVYVPEKREFYNGRATAWNISRFFPVSLPASDMVCLLMGMAPDDGQSVPSPAVEREEGLYRIDQYRSGRKIRSLWIDPAGRLIRIQSIDEKVVYTADFEDYTRVGEGFLPKQVTIRMEDALLTIRYGDFQPIDFDPESFPLPLPEGVVPIPLDP